jgi:hypothetical protein
MASNVSVKDFLSKPASRSDGFSDSYTAKRERSIEAGSVPLPIRGKPPHLPGPAAHARGDAR